MGAAMVATSSTQTQITARSRPARSEYGTTYLELYAIKPPQISYISHFFMKCNSPSEQLLTKLFWCVLISCMQFSKGSKKTKNAEETSAAVPDMSTADAGKTRNSKSSRLKKEASEMGPAKHRKTSSPETVEGSPALKSVVAGAGTEAPVSESRVIDPVGVMGSNAQSPKAASSSSEISPSHEEIAKLAYSYWVERGYGDGSQHQDWLRAEQELKSKR